MIKKKKKSLTYLHIFKKLESLVFGEEKLFIC